jgi:hypothetical protein
MTKQLALPFQGQIKQLTRRGREIGVLRQQEARAQERLQQLVIQETSEEREQIERLQKRLQKKIHTVLEGEKAQSLRRQQRELHNSMEEHMLLLRKAFADVEENIMQDKSMKMSKKAMLLQYMVAQIQQAMMTEDEQRLAQRLEHILTSVNEQIHPRIVEHSE